MDDQLLPFVKDALLAGQPRPAIAEALGRAGWSRTRVKDALGAYADSEFPLPVPRPRPSVSARDAFLSVLLFGLLYLSAFQVGALVFALVDLWLPAPLAPEHIARYARNTLRFSIATLVVTVPLFVAVSAFMRRDAAGTAAARETAVRRWMAYLSLLLASSCLIGNLIGVIYTLLSGDLTLRFCLKAGTIAVVAGAVLAYVRRTLAELDAEEAR
jgi:hypothetical protein